MAGVVDGLEVDAGRMRAALDAGFSQAADVAELLMLHAGLDYRSAYDVVGTCVRRAASEGRRGIDITVDDVAAAATEVGVVGLPVPDAAALAAALDPETIVRSRGSRGGAAPEVVRGMAKDCEATARTALTTVRARGVAWDAAESDVVRRATELVG
jgi:argininosuccinate lyase